jgi:hypothetical protein
MPVLCIIKNNNNMETYIFVALLFISFAFTVKVLYFERENMVEKDPSRKPLPVTVPADPKYKESN